MLYNKATGIPPAILAQASVGVRPIEYGSHALAQAFVKYHLTNKDLPDKIVVCPDTIVEVEVLAGGIHKVVVRAPLTKTHDICIPCLFKPGRLFAKTLWLNRVDDNHSTLRKSNYVCASR